jgi:osmotically inducible protein OsmC
MPTRTASAQWSGDLRSGNGTMSVGSGAFQGSYSFGTRFEESPGTNPEELIAAAEAGCYSMALSAGLSRSGHTPTQINTTAKVTIEQSGGGFAITKIELDCEAQVPGIDDAAFQEAAEATKTGCPVSKALAAVENITLNARLV